MEEDAEMGEDSTSRVSMRASGGTFIAGTADAPVATARATKRRKNASPDVGFAPCKWAMTIHRLRCWIT